MTMTIDLVWFLVVVLYTICNQRKKRAAWILEWCIDTFWCIQKKLRCYLCEFFSKKKHLLTICISVLWATQTLAENENQASKHMFDSSKTTLITVVEKRMVICCLNIAIQNDTM